MADPGLRAELRASLGSGDDYATPGKPQIDWDDPAAREQLIDSRAHDGPAVLALLEGRDRDELGEPVAQAAAMLATVLGQDLAAGRTGRSRSPAASRRIGHSTVDPDTRHGHKTAARGFDGCRPRRGRPGRGNHHRHHGTPATPEMPPSPKTSSPTWPATTRPA